VGNFPVVFPLRYSGETAQTNFVGLLKAECRAFGRVDRLFGSGLCEFFGVGLPCEYLFTRLP